MQACLLLTLNLVLKYTVLQQDDRMSGKDFVPQAEEDNCQSLRQSFSKRKRGDPQGICTAEADKHVVRLKDIWPSVW